MSGADPDTVDRVRAWLSRNVSSVDDNKVTVARVAGQLGLEPEAVAVAFGQLREPDVPDAIRERPDGIEQRDVPLEWPDGTPRFTYVGHCRDDPCHLYVGRHGDNGSKHLHSVDPPERGWLGNPFAVDEHGRVESIQRFARDFRNRLHVEAPFRAEVYSRCRGRVLGCWCHRLDECGDTSRDPCHADVIARVVDQELHTDIETEGPA